MATTTLSSLRTKLQNRLGITSASTLQTSMMNEAINAAISRRLHDGASGLSLISSVALTIGSQSYTGTSKGHTPGTDKIRDTDGSAIGNRIYARPNDIIKFDIGDFLLRRVRKESSTQMDFYVGNVWEVTPSIAAAFTIIHRSIKLVHSGAVTGIKLEDGNALRYDPLAAIKYDIETGTPVAYTQSGQHVALWPAPTAATRVVVVQASISNELSSDSDELEAATEAVDAITESARFIFSSWTGDLDPVEAQTGQLALQDTEDQMRVGGPDVFIKGSRP